MHIKIILWFSLITVILYAAVPLIFRRNTNFQKILVFMNWAKSGFNLERPQDANLKCAKNFYVINNADPKKPLKLGLWHIAATSSITEFKEQGKKADRSGVNEFTEDSRPIVLYVHGNRGDRGTEHRIALYKRITQEFDMHVISFDYRGFGDSSHENPSSRGLTSDTRTVFDWLMQQEGVNKDRVRVWGHSLGTGVACAFVGSLPANLQPPRVVLEAPFDTLSNAISNHPFARPFKWLPSFDHYFVDPIKSSDEINFDSMKALQSFNNTQLLILHAQDDRILPIKLGRRLYAEAVRLMGQGKVKMIELSRKLRLGHKDIHVHNPTMDKVRKFLEVPDNKTRNFVEEEDDDDRDEEEDNELLKEKNNL